MEASFCSMRALILARFGGVDVVFIFTGIYIYIGYGLRENKSFLCFSFFSRYTRDKTGTLKHWPIIFVPIHFVLCLLNLKWSFDLFSPILTKFFHQRKDENYGLKMEGL